MQRPQPKYPHQKLVKLTAEDDWKVLELTRAVLELQREREGEVLRHHMATTSDVLRLLIRRAYEEFILVKTGEIPDTGLIPMALEYGGMHAPTPPNGYFAQS
jgi:hypothetical protein